MGMAMKVKIYNQDGKAKGEQDVNLREDFKETSPQVIHDTITAYRAAQRSGTANTKTIAEVNGTGKKQWRQKGTGNARAGLKQSPIWRKGGVVFGPKPRDYSKDLPKHVRKLAFEQALSTRIQDGDVVVVDSLDVKNPKTQEFVGILKNLKVEGTTLLIHDAPSKNLRLASRNVAWLDTALSNSVNTYQLLNCDKIVLTRAALETLATRNGKKEAQ
jgi:large subunit ribosomal protein L4